MYRKLLLLTFVVILVPLCHAAMLGENDEQGVRDLIGKWDAAYRALDAKAMTALETTDFELVDRFGHWLPQASREENERMWAWVFAEVYRGKPGPQHSIERIRFIHPDVAIVQARAFWAEEIVLPDGTRIPPHGQHTTFVVIKQKKGWAIAAQNVHNKMPGDGPADASPTQLPWKQGSVKQGK